MGYHHRKGFQRLQLLVMVLIFCSVSVIHIKSAYGQLSFAACDINGDRTVDIADAILGLQVLTGFPVTGLSMKDAGKIDLQKIVYALQVQAGVRESESHLVDWDGDGFNAFSGDCDETDPNINPDQPEICGDEIDNNCDGEIDEGCKETVSTPAGEDVGLIGVLDFDFVFDSVTVGGETTVQVLAAAAGAPPAGFLFSDTYYDISTTAQFTGPVQVCIHYDDTGMSAEREAGLQIFHYNENTSQWENITTIPADTENNRICGETTSFSNIALGFSSLVGKWTVWMDYYCDGSDYVLTWEFHAVDILPEYQGITNFKAVLPTGQEDFGSWTWNSIGETYTVNYGFSFNIPGSVSGNNIGGSYNSYNGPVCYSGTRQ